MKFRPFESFAKVFRRLKGKTIVTFHESDSSRSQTYNAHSLNIASQNDHYPVLDEGSVTRTAGTQNNEPLSVALESHPDISAPSPGGPYPMLSPNERSHVEIGGHVIFAVRSIDYVLRIDAALSTRFQASMSSTPLAEGEMRIVSPNLNSTLIPGRRVVLIIGNGVANGPGYDEYIAKVELGYDANASREGRNSLIDGVNAGFTVDALAQTERQNTPLHVHTSDSRSRSGFISRAPSTDINASSILHRPSQTQQLHSILGTNATAPTSPIANQPMRDSKAAPRLHVAVVPPLVAGEGPALSPLSQDLGDEVQSAPQKFSRKTRLDKGKGRLYSPRIVVSEHIDEESFHPLRQAVAHNDRVSEDRISAGVQTAAYPQAQVTATNPSPEIFYETCLNANANAGQTSTRRNGNVDFSPLTGSSHERSDTIPPSHPLPPSQVVWLMPQSVQVLRQPQSNPDSTEPHIEIVSRVSEYDSRNSPLDSAMSGAYRYSPEGDLYDMAPSPDPALVEQHILEYQQMLSIPEPVGQARQLIRNVEELQRKAISTGQGGEHGHGHTKDKHRASVITLIQMQAPNPNSAVPADRIGTWVDSLDFPPVPPDAPEAVHLQSHPDAFENRGASHAGGTERHDEWLEQQFEVTAATHDALPSWHNTNNEGDMETDDYSTAITHPPLEDHQYLSPAVQRPVVHRDSEDYDPQVHMLNVTVVGYPYSSDADARSNDHKALVRAHDGLLEPGFHSREGEDHLRDIRHLWVEGQTQNHFSPNQCPQQMPQGPAYSLGPHSHSVNAAAIRRGGLEFTPFTGRRNPNNEDQQSAHDSSLYRGLAEGQFYGFPDQTQQLGDSQARQDPNREYPSNRQWQVRDHLTSQSRVENTVELSIGHVGYQPRYMAGVPLARQAPPHNHQRTYSQELNDRDPQFDPMQHSFPKQRAPGSRYPSWQPPQDIPGTGINGGGDRSPSRAGSWHARPKYDYNGPFLTRPLPPVSPDNQLFPMSNSLQEAMLSRTVNALNLASPILLPPTPFRDRLGGGHVPNPSLSPLCVSHAQPNGIPPRNADRLVQPTESEFSPLKPSVPLAVDYVQGLSASPPSPFLDPATRAVVNIVLTEPDRLTTSPQIFDEEDYDNSPLGPLNPPQFVQGSSRNVHHLPPVFRWLPSSGRAA